MIMPSAHFFIDFAKGFLSYAVNPGPTKTGSDQSQQAPQLKKFLLQGCQPFKDSWSVVLIMILIVI